MKKLILVFFVILIYQKWGLIDNDLNLPQDYSEAHNGKVILYSTAWCGYCKKTRALLKENNIAYYEYDIDKSREGYEQYKNIGSKGIPVLIINGIVVRGYNPNKILALANKT